MTRTTLIAAAAIASALVSSQAFADVTYYGTSTKLPVSQEQNNASVALAKSARASEIRSLTTEQVFGFPNAIGSESVPAQAGSGLYIGTSGHEQDNADTNMR